MEMRNGEMIKCSYCSIFTLRREEVAKRSQGGHKEVAKRSQREVVTMSIRSSRRQRTCVDLPSADAYMCASMISQG